jgi:hypothetical protein
MGYDCWTSDPPTAPGLYWVVVAGDSQEVASVRESDDDVFDFKTRKTDGWIPVERAAFWGPAIECPPYPSDAMWSAWMERRGQGAR